MVFRLRADVGPLMVVFGSSLPSLTWKKTRCRTDYGPTLNAGLGNLVIIQGILKCIARKPYSFVILFFLGGGGGGLCPPSGSTHAHTQSLVRAFIACLLKVVDIQVRKLSTPSPKDVDCILAYTQIKLRSVQWSYMYIISQFTVKAQMSLRILRGSRKFCQRDPTLTTFFPC